MLEGAKSMGAGAATIASAGAAVGIGNVFSSLIHSVARKGNPISVRLNLLSHFLVRISAVIILLCVVFTVGYFGCEVLGLDFDLLLVKLQSMLLGRAIRPLLFRLVGWEWLSPLILLICLSFFHGDSLLHMVDPAGESGSGAGPSRRRNDLDLELPPSSKDEFLELVADFENVQDELKDLTKQRVEVQSIIDSTKISKKTKRDRILAIQDRLSNLSKTFFNHISERLKEIRSIDRLRDLARKQKRIRMDQEMEIVLTRKECYEKWNEMLRNCINNNEKKK